jgi:hypothetical protein
MAGVLDDSWRKAVAAVRDESEFPDQRANFPDRRFKFSARSQKIPCSGA